MINFKETFGEWKKSIKDQKQIAQKTEEALFGNDKYRGSLLNGVRSGFGIYEWEEGDKYIGNWRKGLYDGFGIYYYADSEIH